MNLHQRFEDSSFNASTLNRHKVVKRNVVLVANYSLQNTSNFSSSSSSKRPLHYSGVEYKVFPPSSGSNFDECKEITLKVLKVNDPCPYSNCTFGGIWNGGGGTYTLVGLDVSQHRTRVGMDEPNKPNSIHHPVDFEVEAKRACTLNFEDVKYTYPRLTEEKRPYVCMDLLYQHVLLVCGFGLDPQLEITVGRGIQYQNSVVEAAWPLALPKFERLMYFI
ncbi:GDA1/CD39 nucleoside phosphatase family protein [Medicago truncatula]|uniref:GDA1/CD39 nucleoside phosphatase family protein n=2 Tax=Medicago truncatula TaxID=3880 RepID=G7KZC6_MEDTR|nr:GDA1/CD39 nucleoside phosphatase family protein [Medicago truncatula]